MTTQKNPPLLFIFAVLTATNLLSQAFGGEQWMIAFDRSYCGGAALLCVHLWLRFPCLR